MAGTPKQSGIYAGSMTVRGNNLQNSLGNVNISGLYNSTSDPSGVLTRQAQDAAVVNSFLGADPSGGREGSGLFDAQGNYIAPDSYPGGQDAYNAMISESEGPTSKELRDIFSDNLTAGDIYGDTLAGYEGVRDAATSAVIAAMQNDYLNSLLEEGQYKGLSAAEQLDLFTTLQATNAPRFISSEEGIRPATEQETADFYDDIVDYLLGLGSVPKTTEDTVIEGTLGENQEEIDRFFGIFNNAETDASTVEKIQEQVRRIGSAVGKAQDTVFDLLGIPKPDYSVIQPNAPGGTVIWGKPSGGVFGRIGTTPGGTVTGVQTGIPALDILLGKVADVASGRATTGDVLNTETIKDIIVQTAGDELGIPGDPNQILADLKEIGSKVFYDDETGKLGVDLGDGSATPTGETPTLGSDRVTTTTTGGGITSTLPTGETPTLTTDKVTTGGVTLDKAPTLTTDRATTGGVTLDKAPTLTTDRATTGDVILDRAPVLVTDRTNTIEDPTLTERTPTLTTDRADEVPGGGGGGGGLGQQSGVRTVSGGPGDVVDIDYLFDITGQSIFAPVLEDENEDEEDKYRPYVYAKSGGMINTYDAVDKLIRFLNRT